MVTENDKRAKYTAKLELKIVQENLNNKGLRQHIKNLKDELQETKVTDCLAELDAVYRGQQMALGSTISAKSSSTQ